MAALARGHIAAFVQLAGLCKSLLISQHRQMLQTHSSFSERCFETTQPLRLLLCLDLLQSFVEALL